MAWVIAEGTKVVQTVARGVAEAVAKRTVVAVAIVLGMARDMLMTVGTLVFWAVDMKMPCDMALKTTIC